jgi:hypothetical protein
LVTHSRFFTIVWRAFWALATLVVLCFGTTLALGDGDGWALGWTFSIVGGFAAMLALVAFVLVALMGLRDAGTHPHSTLLASKLAAAMSLLFAAALCAGPFIRLYPDLVTVASALIVVPGALLIFANRSLSKWFYLAAALIQLCGFVAGLAGHGDAFAHLVSAGLFALTCALIHNRFTPIRTSAPCSVP